MPTKQEIFSNMWRLSTFDASFRWASFLLLSLAFLCAYLSNIVSLENKSHWHDLYYLFSFFLVMSITIWFVSAFTGIPETHFRECIIFAYFFTIVSFVVLLAPLLTPNPRGFAGPIGLAHGCVSASVAEAGPYPKSIMCPDDKNKEASTISATDEKMWLVVIGGLTGTRQSGDTVAASTKAVQKTASEQNYCDTHPEKTFACDFSSGHEIVNVLGGLVVPLYAVILAFVGGAVSLSRRLPEYQRRTEPSYAGTSAEPKLSYIEAREAIVFQLMQLISAPFICITAFYIISPASLGAAAALGFGSGFASETILMLIRGVVTGLRPAITKPQPTVQESESGKDAAATEDTHDGCGASVTQPTADQDLPQAVGGVAK